MQAELIARQTREPLGRSPQGPAHVAAVLPLEWRHVNFDTSEVTLDVHSTKNDEGRVFPMTTDLRALLQAQHV